ncbi:bile acid:sodium symporter family protein [Novipirellula artificiosorum]|uniref:Sodium Bile acid symporter family protein n=1 Tax=Novipirellula artificiosorum TaxID=2528016 RepID=A0A5C6E0N9_9BACT|nr:bile acid:sodium symporter [Novipirellula artificiosorum]TWU42285.1 Sodium Bile acid symporter family protein [Novipirellula artificiosorum]
MWVALKKHWFLLALAACFSTGYFASETLQPLMAMTTLRSGIVFVVMWMMGFTLHAEAIRRSVRRPLPSLLAIGINILVVPLLCLPTQWLLPRAEFGGLYVVSLVPCTLASAAVWTRKAGGNDSIALMTTVVTNLACIVVVPVGVALVLARQADISAIEQMQKLATIVVAPLVLAQAMRYFGLAAFADRHKIRLSFLAQFGILSMVVLGSVASAGVVQQASESASRSMGITLITLALLVMAIHLAAFGIGVFSARAAGADRESQIAVGIGGSQKTLMVGLQIAIDLGVSVIPMLMYHLLQLTIDTVIAARWRAGGEESVPPEG